MPAILGTIEAISVAVSGVASLVVSIVAILAAVEIIRESIKKLGGR